MVPKQYQGVLEIDHDRGVIYFHLSPEELISQLDLVTKLRICGLGKIPNCKMIDITHMVGVSFEKEES